MTSIPLGIKLIEANNEIKKKMFVAIRDELNVALKKIQKPVEDDLAGRIVKKIFVDSPEFQSLLIGPLNAHFGLTPGSEPQILDAILFVIQNSTKVRAKRVGVRAGQFIGGLEAKIEFDYGNLTSLPEASVLTNRGQVLPWLKWMLEEGDKIIIADYSINFGNYPKSRSRHAIMVKEDGGAWRVPPAVSGTENDNWFTRMFQVNQTFFLDALSASIEKNLNKVL